MNLSKKEKVVFFILISFIITITILFLIGKYEISITLFLLYFLIGFISSIIEENKKEREIEEQKKIRKEKERQRRLEEERRQEEQRRNFEEAIAAKKAKLQAQLAEEENKRAAELEAKEAEAAAIRKRAVSRLNTNSENSVSIYSRKLERINFAQLARIKFAKFPEDIYTEADRHYQEEALSLLCEEKLKLNEPVNSSYLEVNNMEFYASEYRHLPSYKKYFTFRGKWKEISFNAFVSYIRHNYTNYDFLVSQIGNDSEAYYILKERVNDLINSILIVLADYDELVFKIYQEDSMFYIMDKQFLESWKWDSETKDQLR